MSKNIVSTVPIRSEFIARPPIEQIRIFDGARAGKLPVESKRSYNCNSAIGRMTKGLLIYITLIVLLLLAIIGLIISIVVGAAVGIVICIIAMLVILILLCIFYYKLYKIWRGFHRPSEFKINSEVAESAPPFVRDPLPEPSPRIEEFIDSLPPPSQVTRVSNPLQLINAINSKATNTSVQPIQYRYIPATTSTATYASMPFSNSTFQQPMIQYISTNAANNSLGSTNLLQLQPQYLNLTSNDSIVGNNNGPQQYVTTALTVPAYAASTSKARAAAPIILGYN